MFLDMFCGLFVFQSKICLVLGFLWHVFPCTDQQWVVAPYFPGCLWCNASTVGCNTVFSWLPTVQHTSAVSCSTVFSWLPTVQHTSAVSCSTVFSWLPTVQHTSAVSCSTVFSWLPTVQHTSAVSCSTVFSWLPAAQHISSELQHCNFLVACSATHQQWVAAL